MDEYVVVLNINLKPIQYVTVKHAVRMIHRGVVSVQESAPDKNIGIYPWPIVVKLIKYIHESWKYSRRPKWSRRNVFIRDKGNCCYCGSVATTIDHVRPVSKGGGNTWLNTVASCKNCNSKKSSKTLENSGLKLISMPFIPTYEHVNKFTYRQYMANKKNYSH